MIAADQVERQRGNRDRFIGEIVNRKNALRAIHALAPETEQGLTELQGELGSVGVKCGLTNAQPNAAGHFVEHARLVAVGLRQFFE